jgi:hypothetical protein
MVSLQAANNNWLAYSNEEQLPSTKDYIGTYFTQTPSYQSELSLKDDPTPDLQVLHTLANYKNSFSQLYQSYTNAFSDTEQYTLFIPLESPLTDELLSIQKYSSEGFSHKDKKLLTESTLQLQRLLERHMVASVIRPNQLEYRNTRITTRGKEIIEINEKGYINQHNKILQSISFPHATIFLIQQEITNQNSP